MVFQYFNKLLQRHFPSSKIAPRHCPNASQMLPRASQEPPKTLPRGSKSAPRGPKMRPTAPKITQMTPRYPPRGSKKPPRGSKKLPRGSQEAPKSLPEVPKQPCQSSQRLPNASQETFSASIFRLSSTIKLASLLASPSISDSEPLQSSKFLSHFASQPSSLQVSKLGEAECAERLNNKFNVDLLLNFKFDLNFKYLLSLISNLVFYFF